MNTAVRGLALVTLLLAVGCYALSNVRSTETIATDGKLATLEIWSEAHGPILSDPRIWPLDAITALVFYPLDVIASSAYAIQAIDDPDLEVRYGPVGALVGIVLPFFTVIPDIYYGISWERYRRLETEQFDRLVRACWSGHGAAVYDQMFFDPWKLRARRSALISVEILEIVPVDLELRPSERVGYWPPANPPLRWPR